MSQTDHVGTCVLFGVGETGFYSTLLDKYLDALSLNLKQLLHVLWFVWPVQIKDLLSWVLAEKFGENWVLEKVFVLVEAELEVKAFENGQNGELLQKLMGLIVGYDLGKLTIAFRMSIISPFAVDAFGFKVSVMYVFGNFFDETSGDEENTFGINFGESIEKGSGVSDLLGIESGLIEHSVGLDLLHNDWSNVLATVRMSLINFVDGVFKYFLQVF